MSYLPFSYVEITDGSNTIKAPTNISQVSGATRGVFVANDGARGIIEPGSSSAEAKSKSFNNGSVLNIRKRFSGKIFNLKFIITENHKENIETIESLIQSNTVSISSDWKDKIYEAQFQRDGYDLDYNNITGAITVSLVFASTEAF